MSHNMPKEKNPQEKKNTNSQSFAAGQWQTGTKIQQVDTTTRNSLPSISWERNSTGRAASLIGIYFLNLKLKIIETLSGYIKTNVWEVKCAYATDIAGGNEKCFYIIRNSQGVIILPNKK